MKTIYTKKFQICLRFISIIASILLAFIDFVILKNYIMGLQVDIYTFFTNAITLLLFIYLAFFPTKLEVLSISCLIQCFCCFYFDVGNTMGILMYFLGVSILYSRGFYIKKANLKKILTGIIFCTLITFSLLKSRENALLFFVIFFGYTFVCLLIIFFIRSYFFDVAENESLKILNLYHYKGLTNRDAQWLNMILEKTKYSAIAINDNMSIGAVKNRIGYIFNVLEVGDKIGFMNKYYGYKIIYVNPKEVL